MERSDEVVVQDNSAAYYEKRYSAWGLKYHRSVIAWMMEEVWPDQAVVDVGCGTGIIERLYPSHLLRGIDISLEMINLAPATCEVGDVNSMPVSNNKADAIVCRSLLHHLPDSKKALSEFHRVLKPRGRVIAWETNKGLLAQWVRSKTQHGDRFSQYHHAFTASELVKDFEQAGFKVDEVKFMGFLAYPLFGFPDIIDFSLYIPLKPILFSLLMMLDEVLSWIPGVKRMAWAIGIKATKCG